MNSILEAFSRDEVLLWSSHQAKQMKLSHPELAQEIENIRWGHAWECRKRRETAEAARLEEIRKQNEAHAEAAIAQFIQKHSGPASIARHDYFNPTDSNIHVLTAWIGKNGALISEATLERAYVVCKQSLER